MEFKGTKGEWKIDYQYAGIYSEHEDKVIEGNIICNAPIDWEESMKSWEANSKLIACAPEMLDVLQDMLDASYLPGHVNDQIKATISKATTI